LCKNTFEMKVRTSWKGLVGVTQPLLLSEEGGGYTHFFYSWSNDGRVHVVVSWHIVFLGFYPATIVVWHVCTIFFFLLKLFVYSHWIGYVPKHASWEAPSDLVDEGMSHGVRTMPKHASWEAPSDVVDGGVNAALELWCVWIPVPEDPITGPGVPSGKMRRCRLFAAAVAQLGSRPVAKGQRRAGSHRTHLCRPMMFSLFPG
jgi:hypothetical protein